MQRYFIAKEHWMGDHVLIEGEDVHHIVRVMRMKEGDKIVCNQPNGRAAVCQITERSEQMVKASIVEWLEQESEMPVHVAIAQGLPKGDKMELVLQKGTELGASEFIPFQAARSVVKWDPKKINKKSDRYKKVAKEASEQAHRTVVPHVETVLSFKELIKRSDDYDVKWFAYEEEAKGPQNQKLSDLFRTVKNGQRILACIGPEGGYTIEEVNQLIEHGFTPIRLGPRILRTETAALYLLAGLSYHFEE
ncbi:16S rRNA (uracil(1498)-N(3))-methyltransferase [Radiobacillus kanasensis]|uniref:16S rRNA (uracil(1498)-N(3))-methyltransferase n=1 Tax=Radiobacillus kanasensis TaxID=2844358 RepID=UPI001E3EE3C9|nr:16S rRNA (uracil(1498)-N(3))-methyltransferase [Radiobacillus kanasensis]UFU01389.1 16S rRNA (uracil(1498)-N(3))-methyltransferase [Radiobacillus kanasensis]